MFNDFPRIHVFVLILCIALRNHKIPIWVLNNQLLKWVIVFFDDTGVGNS